MFNRKFALAVICFALVAGCSTAPITPSIDAFGDAVSGIVAADNATASAKTLPERVNEARRQDFAAARVVYATNDRGACDYVRPDLETASFDQTCQIIPQVLDSATDELVAVASIFDPEAVQSDAAQVIQTSNTALLKEQLGWLLKQDLLTYAQQIAALSKATEPTDIGTSAAAAYTAFTGLDDAISRAEKVNGTEVKKRRAARATFISTIATEALETYRYRLLKGIVEDAEAFVRQASVQLAILEFNTESEQLDAQNQVFIDGIDDQIVGNPESLKKIENRFASMSVADRSASFRRYADIGVAHSAIVEALKTPGDLEQLAEATSRIRALVDAVSAIE
ncbi:hypothetical protein [Roseobacter sp. OBYS 0001]|uniref:hypothetical protein n=1 Tax=Roseobacter sp. OBYS 0001 TaxID=882651 RepID=UPI001BBFFB92|nr:hypothetical protein [Roseobacter sp. OBYS 0001]GIT88884.1 hypothetical protein ROBYS_39000 [Roseobacter sp. OBYS 0001]